MNEKETSIDFNEHLNGRNNSRLDAFDGHATEPNG